MNAAHRNACGFIVVALFLAGCGGGGGGGPSPAPPSPPPPPPPPPTTYTVGGTVTGLTGSVVLQNNGGSDLTVAANGAFTFTPALANGSTYSVSVKTQPSAPAQACTVSSGTGTVSGSNVTGVTVTCTSPPHSAAWSAPTLIESDDAGSARSLQTAIDDSGNAFAVWDQFDGTRYNIWANRYVPTSGWETAAVRENDPGDALAPHVAVDASGNAIAVWPQSDGTRYSICASIFTPLGGWSTPTPLENDPNDARNVQLAANAHGDAFAVWTQTNPVRPIVWARRYLAGSGWGALTRIQSDTNGEGFAPQVAIGPDGSAVAVWHQTDGTRYNVWANRYSPGIGWSNAQLVEHDDTDNALSAQVGIDANGNATAVWQQHDGTRFNIMSNRQPSGGDWGSPVAIDKEDDAASDPHIAMNDAGDAIVLWVQQIGATYNVAANRYTSTSGWATAVVLDTQDGNAIEPRIAMNASGVAHAAWMQNDGTRYNIMASRYAPGSGWEAPALIEVESGDTFSPSIAMNTSGTVQAIWRQHDGLRFNVWASRYE
jgi:hypothetical protein